MNNPYQTPDTDKGDPFLHWSDEYKLRRLRMYMVGVLIYYLSMPVWVTMLVRSVMAGQGLPWWKLGVAVSTFMLATCAALLVRHYRRAILQRMERQQQEHDRQPA